MESMIDNEYFNKWGILRRYIDMDNKKSKWRKTVCFSPLSLC